MDVIAAYEFTHPLTGRGVFVLFDSHVSNFTEQVGVIYQLFDNRSVYCLRPNELFQLWQPGVFAPPFQVNEYPHLPFYLRHKGELIVGEEMRSQIKLPHCDQTLLWWHIEACRDSLRRYGILPLLFEEKYGKLVKVLRSEVAHLMATALLTKREWEIELNKIAPHFADFFPDERLNELATAVFTSNPTDRQAALSVVYQFEQFLTQLERAA